MTITDTSNTQIRDIERWRPARWDQVVGNSDLKEYFSNMIHCVRKGGHRSGFNALITGPSRGGKTSTVKLGIQCIGCLQFDFDNLTPCGKCANCTMNTHLYGNDGWENYIDFLNANEVSTPIRYSYTSLDCSRLTESELEAVIDRLHVNDDNLRIVYLDEVHRLARRNMDERLLKALEDFPAIWIASSANVKKEDQDDGSKLDKMFQNRFSFRITTQKPTTSELTIWLARRCQEFGIRCEGPEQTLRRLAERSNQLPGMALQVLNKVHKSRTRVLTRQVVDDFVFDLDC